LRPIRSVFTPILLTIRYTYLSPMNIRYRMTKFLDWAWIGVVTMITDAIIPFIIPVRWYILFMICSISVDTITGIIAALKVKERITSKGIWRTIEKIGLASVVILTSYGFERVFLPDIPMTKGVSMIIAFAEMTSIFENYYKITGVDIGTTILSLIKQRVFPTVPAPSDNKISDDDRYQ